MNLMEESFQNKTGKKKSKAPLIILICMVLLIIAIIAIGAYIVYLKDSELKLYLDGQENSKVKDILKFETDGTVYVPIKEVAKYLGYESYNGEYSNKSEEQSKCYIQSENEVTNFELGSKKIYKLDLTNQNNQYEYIYMEKPIKAYDGILYISAEELSSAFNVSFEYNKEKNRIYIYTLQYLVEAYTNKIMDWGYFEISDVFANKKTILQNMLVVNKDKDNPKYAVIDTEGNTIIEAKYDNITYLPSVGDFLVKSDEKVGIISKNKEKKVQIIYDTIELMDSDSGLYIVGKDSKYGVIDTKGNTKIHIENDEIGVDISKYTENDIKNKYLLADGVIPVRKDKLWALYDKNGKQLTEFKYDSFGYTDSNNRNALSLLVIPDYNVIVASKDKKYTLLNSSGEELMAIVADDIYMSINEGKKSYTISANDKDYDAKAYLDSRASKNNSGTDKKSNTEESTDTNTNASTENSTTNTNKTNKTNTTRNNNSEE